MDFLNELKETIEDNNNVVETENGAVGYKTTLKPVLDMNFKIPSYRDLEDSTLEEDFEKAYSADMVHALKWMCYLRDIRNGLGERSSFRRLLQQVIKINPAFAEKLIPRIPSFGRYDDLFVYFDTPLEQSMLTFVYKTLRSDMHNYYAGFPTTLLAKWLPSVNASSPETIRRAKKMIKAFNISEKEYRKTLSKLRAHLQVVECDLSAKNWGSIDYSRVPSKANLIYRNCFTTHDKDRYYEFVKGAMEQKNKINASVLNPHEIVRAYRDLGSYWDFNYKDEVDMSLEALWDSLAAFSLESTLVVADGSGSMECQLRGSECAAIDVANAMAVYCSEGAKGVYKNKYITFSESPQFVELTEDTLLGKLKVAAKHTECANTNIKAVFDLILQTAISNKVPQSDLPDNILIISDMEFDCGAGFPEGYSNDTQIKRLFDEIKISYEQNGYKLPRLIFWNVNSRTNAIPMRTNDLGVMLVSGFSINILNMVMSNELDPYKCLLKALDSPGYDFVEELLEE